jgi:predicted protein tyrosine phosphatase
MAILVCPLSQVERVCAARAPARLISLLDPASAFPKPVGLPVELHLKLPMHDIVDEHPDWQAPQAAQVDQLLAFVAGWDRGAPLLIHCFAGISRSTATAFIAACVQNPQTDETEIAWALRRASASAYPNRRLVALADSALGRGGRLSAAIAAIGPGSTWEQIGEAIPFEIPSRYDAAA